jgi:hypothetical protein
VSPSSSLEEGTRGLNKPLAVLIFVEMVNVEVTAAPLGVTLAGLKTHVESAGSPLQERLVAALKLLIGVIVTVTAVELPFVTVALAGVSEIEKSGTGAALTVTATAADTDALFPGSPP